MPVTKGKGGKYRTSGGKALSGKVGKVDAMKYRSKATSVRKRKSRLPMKGKK